MHVGGGGGGGVVWEAGEVQVRPARNSNFATPFIDTRCHITHNLHSHLPRVNMAAIVVMPRVGLPQGAAHRNPMWMARLAWRGRHAAPGCVVPLTLEAVMSAFFWFIVSGTRDWLASSQFACPATSSGELVKKVLEVAGIGLAVTAAVHAMLHCVGSRMSRRMQRYCGCRFRQQQLALHELIAVKTVDVVVSTLAMVVGVLLPPAPVSCA